MKLSQKINITGIITLKTGMYIGGTNTAMKIGGVDNMVVRDPITKLPYIPGSSLKGKLRSLIEIKDGTTRNGDPTELIDTRAAALFGTSSSVDNGHPSRLIVRDAFLTQDCIEKFNSRSMPFTENKTEVAINRITAESNPRTFERVPAGATFALNMVLNVMDYEPADKEKASEVQLKAIQLQSKENLIATLKEAIALLENDYIGGQGSRGYGHIEIKYDGLE